MLVLAEDDLEKVMLAFVETERCDCSDMRELERCRTKLSYDFLVWEAARWGITGVSTLGDALFPSGTVKKDDRWFGLADNDRLGVSTSGLVGGEDAVVCVSDNSSSDLCEDVVELAVFGKISGALYDNMLVVWISSMGAEILWRIDPTALLVVLLRCGLLSAASAAIRLCLTRRVVKALAIDMLAT